MSSAKKSEEIEILGIIPAKKGMMISEIELVNRAYFKYNISPFKTLQIVRELLRDGIVYQPRGDFYRKT